jgi:hypothetical protein
MAFSERVFAKAGGSLVRLTYDTSPRATNPPVASMWCFRYITPYHPNTSHYGAYFMRLFFLSLFAITVLTFTACGGARTEQSYTVEQAVSQSNAEGFTAKLLYRKQSDRYLIVGFQFSNDTQAPISLKNDNNSHQFAAFSATCEGRQINAERRGSTTWNPWTGVQHRENTGNYNLELAPGQKTELQVRFNYTPNLTSKDYSWSVTITNIYHGDKKLGDLTFAFDPKAK